MANVGACKRWALFFRRLVSYRRGKLNATFVANSAAALAFASASVVLAQPTLKEVTVMTEADSVDLFRLSGVSLLPSTYLGKAAFEMRMPPSAYQDPTREQLSDRDFMAWLPIDFTDGTIEVDVASDLAADAPGFARGFVGISFRIGADGSFESIYLRPTNSDADDEQRRKHVIQYAAYPDFRFYSLREQAPGKYERPADIGLARWIRMKIVVNGTKASLYLDGKEQPAMVVDDLKLGKAQRGGVGIWLETGSVVHFRRLRITEGIRP